MDGKSIKCVKKGMFGRCELECLHEDVEYLKEHYKDGHATGDQCYVVDGAKLGEPSLLIFEETTKEWYEQD